MVISSVDIMNVVIEPERAGKPQDDYFAEILSEANAAADALMNSDQQIPHFKNQSIGILDLDNEDGLSQEVSDESVDCLLGSQILDYFNPISTPAFSHQSLDLLWNTMSDRSSSIDMKSLTLELQNSLRAAETEVDDLRRQVTSKTHHLELAQKALVECEDEMQSLRNQLRELTEFGKFNLHEQPCHQRTRSHENFVKDLRKVKNGTHRIRQSLSGSEAEDSKENVERLTIHNEDLQQSNKRLQEDVYRLKTELDSAWDKIQELQGTTEDLMEEKGSLYKEKTKLKAQLLQAQEELLCILNDSPDPDEEVSMYIKRLKASQDQRENLQRELDCLRTELEAIKVNQKQVAASDEAGTDRLKVLDSKLQENSEILEDKSDQPAETRIRQLKEALSLSLEAKALLEERLASKEEAPSEGLKLILEDIDALKENFQKERRMALRERTENENLILNLQQEKEELVRQMEQVTAGLDELQAETERVQDELKTKKKNHEEFRAKAERRARDLELENASVKRRLAQVREALDLCLEAKRELEIRCSQSSVILCDWMSSNGMKEEESFTATLRRRVDSGDIRDIKQAALQAIEQLEGLQEEASRRFECSSMDQSETQSALSDCEVQSDGRMMTVTSQQLRALRKELREVTKQRDEAFKLLKGQKVADARRFSEIQELQSELNAALEQNEALLPRFHEVINSKRELENKLQEMTDKFERHDGYKRELESFVVELMSVCHKLLKISGRSLPPRGQSLLESILWTRNRIEEIADANKRQHRQLGRHRGDGSSSGSQSSNRQDQDMAEQLRGMLEREREMKLLFESQSEKLGQLRADSENRSHWVRNHYDTHSTVETDSSTIELQRHERLIALKKAREREEEIAELLEDLSKVDDDKEIQMSRRGSEESSQLRSNLSSSSDLNSKLNRLQECAGSLEQQLMAVKKENKDLKAERQFLLKRSQTQL